MVLPLHALFCRRAALVACINHESDDRARSEKDSARFELVCCSCLELGSGRCSKTALANVSSDLRPPWRNLRCARDVRSTAGAL